MRVSSTKPWRWLCDRVVLLPAMVSNNIQPWRWLCSTVGALSPIPSPGDGFATGCSIAAGGLQHQALEMALQQEGWSPAPSPGEGFATKAVEPRPILLSPAPWRWLCNDRLGSEGATVSLVSSTEPWRWLRNVETPQPSRVRSGRVSSTKPWRWLCDRVFYCRRWSPIPSPGDGFATRGGDLRHQAPEKASQRKR